MYNNVDKERKTILMQFMLC